MYAINLGAISLFADLPFYVFSDVCIWCIILIWMNIVCFCQKIKKIF